MAICRRLCQCERTYMKSTSESLIHSVKEHLNKGTYQPKSVKRCVGRAG